MSDISILWSLVRRQWVVSTIERDSSAADGPRRHHETLVFRWDEAKEVRGEQIAMGGGLAWHQWAVLALLQDGEAGLAEYDG